MKRNLLLSVFLAFSIGSLPAQTYREIDRDELLELLSRSNDTTYVVNFWATWCSPCVKEIPYFEELHRDSNGEKLRVVLVSLDFPKQAEMRLLPFLKDKGVTASVLLMNDHKYNEWIDLVEPSWSGAIPATLVFKNGERAFLEKELERDELYEFVEQIHN